MTEVRQDVEKSALTSKNASTVISIENKAVNSHEKIQQAHDHTLTDWDGPDDPGRPWNWSLGKRIYGVAIPAWYAFVVTCGSSIYAAGIPDVGSRFHVSQTVSILGISLYTLGIALGPIFGAPISETLGRRWVYWITMPLFILFTAGVGLASNIGTVLVCRLLSGLFGAPAVAVGAGSVADLFSLQRGGGIAGMCFTLMPYIGSSLGPLIGGYTVEARQDYAWTMWVLIMIAGPAWIASLFLDETSQKIILERRALERGMQPPPKPSPTEALKILLTVTLVRPVHMLLTEPIIGWLSLYVSFAFAIAILFAFFESFPYVFTTIYDFSLGEVGLTYLGIIVGVFTAAVVFVVIDKTIYAKAKARISTPGKIPPPEERLYVCMVGSFLLPISLFWFAWSARTSVHWIAPVLAGLPFGCGLVLLFFGTALYLIDAYQALNAASAMAANSILRYTLAAAFPLFTIQMFDRLGIDWAVSLLGFLSILLLPIPWVLYRWEPFLRRRSSCKMGNF